jgi:hypothetical protein
MYNTTRGIAFGEFTVHPGAYTQFAAKWDRTLGRWYAETTPSTNEEMADFVERFRKVI